jgi:hypothetical protein
MKNNKGFGIIALLAIIVILGTLVGTGIYIKDRQKQSTLTTNSQTDVTKDKTQTSQSKANQTSPSKAEIVQAPAEKVKFSALPTQLQNVYKAKVTEKAPACIKNGQIVDYDGQPEDKDATYAPVGSAIIVIGCDGGSASLFAKDKQDTWKFIASTQSSFKCDDIFDNPVPLKLMELGTPRPECFETATNTVVSYQDALNKRFY